jgi:hypothetical protein
MPDKSHRMEEENSDITVCQTHLELEGQRRAGNDRLLGAIRAYLDVEPSTS